MKLAEELYQIPVAPEHHLKMTYAQLNVCGMDFDFISVLQDGKDFHKITRDICISYQKFHGLPSGVYQKFRMSSGQYFH